MRARRAGLIHEVIAALHQASALAPENAQLILELGSVLLNAGRAREALPWLDKAAALQQRSAQVQLRRGMALEQLGWHAEATEAYEHAVALSPKLPDAHARLGVILLMQDKRPAAAESLHKAAKLAPGTSLGRLCKAYALKAEGRAEAAQDALRQLIAMEPGNAPAHAELGKLLAESGQGGEARAAFEQAVRIDPRSAGHFYELVRVRPLGEADRPLLEEMCTVSQRKDLGHIHRVMLELAIGKAYDDLGESGQAMQHYLAGNALKAQMRPLDRDLVTRRVDWAIETFTPECLAANEDVGCLDETPLLIVGMPRSGTTLVESVLACHSRVDAGQELPFWGRCGRQMAEAGEAPGGEKLQEIAARYLELLRGISPAAHVTDKKPDNFFWLGLIHLAFPRARIIHCRRDPLDTCVSILSSFFAPRPDFSTEPDDLVFYYREYERLMAHWRSVLPSARYLELDYETLVTEPQGTIERLLGFCELDWEEACLYPERSGRKVNTASLWQVRQPITPQSIGRWRRYAPWLGGLAALQQGS